MRTVPSTIAIVSDCDDTLAPDTTAQLLARFGVDPKGFYERDAGKLIGEGFDPSVAYMNAMLALARNDGILAGLTLEAIGEFAGRLEFYPGVPDIFHKLDAEIRESYNEYGIRLKEYVITGGLADLVAASNLGRVVDKIWGCNFGYDAQGRISCIKNVVSFTEKTRFLFDIEKGLATVGTRGPYDVNLPMEPEERPVPMRNMIYLGDGPSDIPCMSIIQKAQGFVIGILSKQNPYKTWALGFGRRAHVTVPPDFREGEHGHAQLRQSVIQIAERIKRELEMTTPGPGHTPRP